MLQFGSRLFALYETSLLILCLALLAPFWRDIDAILLFFVSLLFGLMHSGSSMLCWTVDSIQAQRCRSCIDKLMLRTSWDDDQVTSPDFLILTIDRSQALSRSERQDLVDCMFLRQISQRYSLVLKRL